MMVARPRIKKTNGKSYPVKTGCGEFKMTVTLNNGSIQDVIFTVIKQDSRDSCMQGNIEGHGRIITLAVRQGVEIDKIIKTLKDIKCPKQPIEGALSCSDGIARALEAYLKDNPKESK